MNHLVAHGGPANAASSTNWSGYAAASGTYKSVSATWNEPTGTCSGSAKYSSFWVGLDGFSSRTVEQTGSEVDCQGGSPRYFAWFERFPAFPVNFSNTVRPGDHFTASVTHTSGNSYTLVIKDTTQGWTHTEHKSLASAKNSSAEVIAEAPSTSSGVLPLADFGKVHFTSSKVNGKPMSNASPTKITMVNGGGRAKDSVSGLTGGGNFTVTWKHST
ncbi:MAG: G1 family glutamic endopeptidase [Streptosporangiaceae bacterium]